VIKLKKITKRTRKHQKPSSKKILAKTEKKEGENNVRQMGRG
jgi:hypothetical protein